LHGDSMVNNYRINLLTDPYMRVAPKPDYATNPYKGWY